MANNKTNQMTVALSRRALLKATTAATGAGFLLNVAPRTGAAAKLSQQIVAYQDHPDGNKRCDRCSHFQAPTACQIVQGPVRPDGYCKFFTPRGQA